MTQNHNYDTPAQGATNWDLPLNSNFEQLDTDVEIRDSKSNVGTYQPKAGAKFLATDTGDVYLGDGSAWNRLGGIADTAGTVSASIQRELLRGNVVPMAPGTSAADAIDPATTNTPIQDGIDAVAKKGGGYALLPPTTIPESGPVHARTDTGLVGFGPDTTKISFPANSDGLVFDASQNGGQAVSRFSIDGVALNGPGPTTSSGVAVHFTDGDTSQCTFGHVIFWGWKNSVYRVDSGVGPFENRHELLTVYGCDAGDENALFEFNSWYGPAQWFGTVVAYPESSSSGKTSTLIYSKGGTQLFDVVTTGGTIGTLLHQLWDGNVRVGTAHWEPENSLAASAANPGALFRFEGGLEGEVGRVKLVNVSGTASTVDYVYELAYDSYMGRPANQKRLGPVFRHRDLVNQNVVDVASPIDRSLPSFYDGATADVDVTHSSGKTGGLRVLGEAGVGMG